jgi:hypothetical protein
MTINMEAFEVAFREAIKACDAGDSDFTEKLDKAYGLLWGCEDPEVFGNVAEMLLRRNKNSEALVYLTNATNGNDRLASIMDAAETKDPALFIEAWTLISRDHPAWTNENAIRRTEKQVELLLNETRPTNRSVLAVCEAYDAMGRKDDIGPYAEKLKQGGHLTLASVAKLQLEHPLRAAQEVP